MVLPSKHAEPKSMSFTSEDTPSRLPPPLLLASEEGAAAASRESEETTCGASSARLSDPLLDEVVVEGQSRIFSGFKEANK